VLISVSPGYLPDLTLLDTVTLRLSDVRLRPSALTKRDRTRDDDLPSDHAVSRENSPASPAGRALSTRRGEGFVPVRPALESLRLRWTAGSRAEGCRRTINAAHDLVGRTAHPMSLGDGREIRLDRLCADVTRRRTATAARSLNRRCYARKRQRSCTRKGQYPGYEASVVGSRQSKLRCERDNYRARHPVRQDCGESPQYLGFVSGISR
jgi:hypothetical protein